MLAETLVHGDGNRVRHVTLGPVPVWRVAFTITRNMVKSYPSTTMAISTSGKLNQTLASSSLFIMDKGLPPVAASRRGSSSVRLQRMNDTTDVQHQTGLELTAFTHAANGPTDSSNRVSFNAGCYDTKD